MLNQHYYIAPDAAKPHVLYQLLKNREGVWGLIYCQTRREIEALTRQLKGLVTVESLHGGLAPELRKSLIENFKRKRFNLLLLTEGLGQEVFVDGVNFVLYYEVPQEMNIFKRQVEQLEKHQQKSDFFCFFTPYQQNDLEQLQQRQGLRMEKHPSCLMSFKTPEEVANQIQSGQKTGSPKLQQHPKNQQRNNTNKGKGNQPSTPSRWV